MMNNNLQNKYKEEMTLLENSIEYVKAMKLIKKNEKSNVIRKYIQETDEFCYIINEKLLDSADDWEDADEYLVDVLRDLVLIMECYNYAEYLIDKNEKISVFEKKISTLIKQNFEMLVDVAS